MALAVSPVETSFRLLKISSINSSLKHLKSLISSFHSFGYDCQNFMELSLVILTSAVLAYPRTWNGATFRAFARKAVEIGNTPCQAIGGSEFWYIVAGKERAWLDQTLHYGEAADNEHGVSRIVYVLQIFFYHDQI